MIKEAMESETSNVHIANGEKSLSPNNIVNGDGNNSVMQCPFSTNNSPVAAYCVHKKSIECNDAGDAKPNHHSDQSIKQAKEDVSPIIDLDNKFSTVGLSDEIVTLEDVNSLPIREQIGNSRKKLLVLDLNGLLVDIISRSPNNHKADMRVAGKAVFKRPYCLDFLKFCLEKFEVGVWSSRKRLYIDKVVDYLMGDIKQKLLFCWDISQCTDTQFRTLENRHKQVVFKDLRKIWEKGIPDLPWQKGYYNESNTLLLDDSPYKALLNPAHTGIFPFSYQFQDRNDNSLGNGGDLRVYLEGLAAADNVPDYVAQHPFGQKAITEDSPSWGFYLNIISTLSPFAVST